MSMQRVKQKYNELEFKEGDSPFSISRVSPLSAPPVNSRTSRFDSFLIVEVLVHGS